MANHVIRSGDLVRIPWKNGGGTTAEIAAFPEKSGFETFGWRISMADVASDGPFSSFPGIDRTLIVVEGDGIELDVAGVPHRLDSDFPKLSFSGDDATMGRLLSGPIRDLNVMTRRGCFRQRVRIVESGITSLPKGICAAIIVAMDGPLDVTVEDAIYSLQVLDTLALEPMQETIQVAGSGRAILIEVAPEDAALNPSPPDLSLWRRSDQ